MAKKPVTKKKRTYNVDELRAYKEAYGGTLGVRDHIFFIAVPGLMFGILSFLLLYNGWVSAAVLLYCGIYGFRKLMPLAVKKNYEANAFNERNKFLNNITQVLTDESQTVPMALKKVTPRSQGEFQEDIQRFHALIVGADQERLRTATRWFADRYEDDVIFIQYIEQLETAMLEGKTNVDTLKDIKTYHNDIRKKQDFYEARKNGHLTDMKQLVLITAILVIALAVSFGFDVYLEAFARHIIGYITSAIYLLIMWGFFKKFVSYLFDDSVMEIRAK